MALGDFTLYNDGAFGAPGSKKYAVASGAAATIKAGEPVGKALGNTSGSVVATLANAKPVAGTDFLAGISASTSTDTAAAAGVVEVFPCFGDGVTWLCAPTVAASWDTQSEYDALVGARVVLTKSSGVYTVDASDGANNGLVVEPLDISKYPAKVRISFRKGCNFLA